MPREIAYNKEADVKRRVKKLLDQHDFFYWMPPANGFGKSGVADIIAFRHGVLVAIETKFGTNKPTAMQVAFLNTIRSHDGFGFVVSDRNIEWFETWLAAFDRSAAAVSNKQEVAPEDGASMLDAIRAMTALL